MRGIVFDLDGTLIDSYLDIATSLNEVLDRLGRPRIPIESVKKMIGAGVHVLLQRALKDDRPELLEAARTLFGDAYRARLTEHTRPYPGVLETLRALAAHGLLLAIATNKPSFFTDPIVRALGLDAAGVLAWASADEAGARKPSPKVVELALERAAKIRAVPAPPASEIAYAGDMPIDLETARAMGCRMIGVGWGFDPAGLRALQPNAFIERPEALIELLSDWK